MDAARSLATDEIVEAEDLKILGHVDRYGYVCHGQECGIQVFPRSYRVENLLRAHFFTRSTHTSSCDVAGEDEVRSRGKKSKRRRGAKNVSWPITISTDAFRRTCHR